MTTTKPIWVDFTRLASSLRDSYADYTIERNNTTIFAGKTYVDASGNTSFRIDRVLNDYLYRWEIATDHATQRQRPANLLAAVNEQLYTVEFGGSFWYDTIKVKIGSTTKTLQGVTGAWVPAWQAMKAIEPKLQNWATMATDVAPRVPHVSTDNFWVGVVMSSLSTPLSSRIECNGSSLSGGGMNLSIGGTNAFAIPLRLLFRAATYRKGKPYQIANTQPGGNKMTICDVDDCPADYYVSWITPTGGWSSYGFFGNASVQGNVQQRTLLNMADETEVYKVETTQQFNLYSDYITPEVYGHLMTITSSRRCYVYDVRNDCGFYCIPKTTGLATVPTQSVTPNFITLTLQKAAAETN